MIELFVTFFKLGAFTIGGGIAMIPILRDIMVNDKKWFSEEEMLDIITICQGLPGVVAVNMATYVGFKKRGLLGSLVATIGVVLPSFIIILIVAKGLALFSENPYIAGALGGLKAGAVGLIIVAVYQIGKAVIKDAYTLIASIIAFVMIAFLKIGIIYVIILFFVIGVIRSFYFRKKIGGDDK